MFTKIRNWNWEAWFSSFYSLFTRFDFHMVCFSHGLFFFLFLPFLLQACHRFLNIKHYKRMRQGIWYYWQQGNKKRWQLARKDLRGLAHAADWQGQKLRMNWSEKGDVISYHNNYKTWALDCLTKVPIFKCQKIALPEQKQKKRDHFKYQHPPKMVDFMLNVTWCGKKWEGMVLQQKQKQFWKWHAKLRNLGTGKILQMNLR